MKLVYRADIDGLRAVAVLAVVLFHAKFSPFSGGFVGVDVFFVISGYLITSLVLKHEGSTGVFLRAFYEGRIRRLLPPAIPVLLFSSIAGLYLFSIEDMEEYAVSLIAFFLFLSNWFFLDVSGYFDGPSHLKPLLHTWSLSIEEQFYLFFPLAVLGLRRCRPSMLWAGIAALILASFAVNVYFVAVHDLDAAFYNSFGRFWEMALGALLACRVLSPPATWFWKNIIGVAGLSIIIGCVVLLDSSVAFPGFWALLPTVGAAMVIHAQGGLAGKLLSTRAAVGIGLISYALYLWHWPLFAFLTIIYGEPTAAQFALAIAVAFALSVLSYVAIERPVRSRRILPQRYHAVALCVMAVCLFGGFGAAGHITNGFPFRLPAAAVEYYSTLENQIAAQRRTAMLGECWVAGDGDMESVIERCVKPDDGRPRVLLTGDSHAAQLYGALREARPDLNISLLASHSCTLSGHHSLDKRRPACLALTAHLDHLKAGDFAGIVMTIREVLEDRYLHAFIDRAARLSKIASVYVAGPIPFYKPKMGTIYAGLTGRLTPDMISSRLDAAVQADQFTSEERYRALLATKPTVHYISLLDVLCPQRKCRHFDGRGLPILIDGSHMSLQASHELAQAIAPRILLPSRVMGDNQNSLTR